MIRINCPVRNSALSMPGNTAIIGENARLTYRDLDDKINSLAGILRKRGVEPGMKVGVMGENSIRFIVIFFAMLRLGVTVIPLNFRFPDKKTNEIISNIGMDILVSRDSVNTRKDKPIKKLLLDELFRPDDSIENRTEKMEYITGGMTIILTSGSTGMEKGVLLSAENHYFSTLGSNENIELSESSRWMLILPLFHVGGLAILFRVFNAGASVLLPSGKEVSVGEELERGGATHISMVHTQLAEYITYLENLKKYPSADLKAVLAGGGSIPEPLIKKGIDMKVPIYKTYGLTEMSSQVTTTVKPVNKTNLSTSGHLLKFRELMIGPGNEVLVRGKTLSPGYISGRKFIPLKTDENGWFNTGDLGNFGESGDLFLSGRKDNMFISGGENVFPEEIESELLRIENIVEAVVVSIENEKYGNRPVAFISTGGKNISRNEIVKRLKARIPGFKVPDKFYFLDNIRPGQVKRRRPFLKELAKRGKGLKIISD